MYGVHLTWARFKLTTLVVIGTDSMGSCKYKYHTITATLIIEHYSPIQEEEYVKLVFVVYWIKFVFIYGQS
jgi:hypothetical protein